MCVYIYVRIYVCMPVFFHKRIMSAILFPAICLLIFSCCKFMNDYECNKEKDKCKLTIFTIAQ